MGINSNVFYSNVDTNSCTEVVKSMTSRVVNTAREEEDMATPLLRLNWGHSKAKPQREVPKTKKTRPTGKLWWVGVTCLVLGVVAVVLAVALTGTTSGEARGEATSPPTPRETGLRANLILGQTTATNPTENVQQCREHTKLGKLWFRPDGWCAAKGRPAYQWDCLSAPVILDSDECWSASCPHQIGDYMSWRAADLGWWALTEVQALASDFITTVTFPLYANSTERERIPDQVIVAGAGDWGSGTCEAEAVGALIAVEDPYLTLHLGDVYYTGTNVSFEHHMLGKTPSGGLQHGTRWPKGRNATFLMNGNHEMLRAGVGLLDAGFKLTGQKTTYRLYENTDWQLYALDSAWLCYTRVGDRLMPLIEDRTNGGGRLPDAVVAYVNETRNQSKGLVLFTHHQPLSGWEDTYDGGAKQLAPIVGNKTVVWLFGHEHRLAIYHQRNVSGVQAYGRLVGHGGFSDSVEPPKRPADVEAYDNRTYQTLQKSDDWAANERAIGYNGFFTLTFTHDTLVAQYKTGKCLAPACANGMNTTSADVVFTEAFRTSNGTVHRTNFTNYNLSLVSITSP